MYELTNLTEVDRKITPFVYDYRKSTLHAAGKCIGMMGMAMNRETRMYRDDGNGYK